MGKKGYEASLRLETGQACGWRKREAGGWRREYGRKNRRSSGLQQLQTATARVRDSRGAKRSYFKGNLPVPFEIQTEPPNSPVFLNEYDVSYSFRKKRPKKERIIFSFVFLVYHTQITSNSKNLVSPQLFKKIVPGKNFYTLYHSGSRFPAYKD